MNGNYELLANAIIIQAVHDYRRALCEQHDIVVEEERLAEEHDTTNFKIREKKFVESEIKELEKFFLGEDIRLYTKLDGRMIMEKIRQQVIKANYDMKELSKTYKTKSALPDEED